jgi:hypothetical protein
MKMVLRRFGGLLIYLSSSCCRPTTPQHLNIASGDPTLSPSRPSGTSGTWPRYVWIDIEQGDCFDHDVGDETAGAAPKGLRCNAQTVSSVAVCWDGISFGRGAPARCTYKTPAALDCKDGGTKGYRYVCKAVNETP